MRDPSVDEHISFVGVTGGTVASRVANAQYEATYLLAGVDVVREYTLVNINRKKLESLLQRFFESARLDIEIEDRFGKKVRPREWFLVPLAVIDQVVDLIKNGEVIDYRYNRDSASLVKLEAD